MKPTVFVSGSVESAPLIHSLRTELASDVEVIAWTDGLFSIAQPPLAQLSRSAAAADFAVILISFDEIRGDRPGPRDNVLFELGFLVGKLGAERVLIVDTSSTGKSIRVPTDLAGFTIVRAPTERRPYDPVVAKFIANEVRRRALQVDSRFQGRNSPTYSCFISYSHEDHELASRLYDDLSEVGARCWLDRHELRVGDSLADQINAALLTTDKFLPILSLHALSSPWFGRELVKALELERKRATTVLIPIRVDDAIFTSQGHPWVEIRDRLMADFHEWRSEGAYRAAFRHLAQALAVSVSEDRTPEAG